jgi:ABC-type phosphate transport system permease subunit
MKGIKFKKLTAMLAALSLMIMLIPTISMTANAQTTEVTNEAELKSALDSGATDITISGKVTISSNSLTINSGVTLSITRGVSSDGITIDLLRNYHFFEVTDAANQVKP